MGAAVARLAVNTPEYRHISHACNKGHSFFLHQILCSVFRVHDKGCERVFVGGYHKPNTNLFQHCLGTILGGAVLLHLDT